MTGVSIKQLWLSSIAVVSMSAACGTSKTADQISGFADKVCACSDAPCATNVQTEYLTWWQENQRARGSEGDRKDVEKAMERYAECHLRLVGPDPVEAPSEVPKVDLDPTPKAPTATPPVPGSEDAGAEGIRPKSAEGAAEGDSKAAKDDPPTP